MNQVQGLGPSKPSDSGSSPNDTIYLCNFRVGGEEKAKCTKNNPLSTSLKATHTYILFLLHFLSTFLGTQSLWGKQCNTALDHPAHDIVKKNTKCIKPWSKVEKKTCMYNRFCDDYSSIVYSFYLLLWGYGYEDVLQAHHSFYRHAIFCMLYLT